MFSVVIPLYNKAAVVSNTLESVLNQTYTNFEILIVNDGSTDNSLEVIRKFRDNRIKVFSKENGGVSSARNYGIMQAKGEYIAFLDADDIWKPDFLREINRLIAIYPGCGIYSSGYILTKKQQEILYAYPEEGIIKEYFKKCFKNGTLYCHTSCVVIPAPVFLEVGYFPENICAGEDLYMWIKVAKKYAVCVTPLALAVYQYQFSSQTTWMNKKYRLEDRLFIDLYEPGNFYLNEYLARLGIYRGIRQALANNKEYSRLSEKEYSYTKCNRKLFYFLRLLNRLPYIGIYTVKKGWELGVLAKGYLYKLKK